MKTRKTLSGFACCCMYVHCVEVELGRAVTSAESGQHVAFVCLHSDWDDSSIV
jgi:hypothetical protein